MLRQFGVRGVKVREIFSLDDEMLSFLPFVENAEVNPLGAYRLIYVLVVLSTDSYSCSSGGKMTQRSKNYVVLRMFGSRTRYLLHGAMVANITFTNASTDCEKRLCKCFATQHRQQRIRR